MNNKRNERNLMLAAPAVFALVAACGSSEPAPCAVGEQLACICPDTSVGAAMCTDAGIYGGCACGSTEPEVILPDAPPSGGPSSEDPPSEDPPSENPPSENPPSEPMCGDGQVDAGETCDDGGTRSGDGCSASCELEYCGDGVVNNGSMEECEGGPNCTDDCQLNPGPALQFANIEAGEVDVPANRTLTLEFDEALSVDSVLDGAIELRATGWVHGTYYADEPVDAAISVSGTRVEIEARGELQEFETTYALVISPALMDTQGAPTGGEEVRIPFTTEGVSEGHGYAIVSPQFEEVIAVRPEDERLVLEQEITMYGVFRFEATADGYYCVASAAYGSERCVEGGDGTGSGILGGELQFSGQLFQLHAAGETPEKYEGASPATYHLQTMFQGEGRSLGVMHADETHSFVGMEDTGWLDQTWYLVDLGAF